jgi:hypothetical protein
VDGSYNGCYGWGLRIGGVEIFFTAWGKWGSVPRETFGTKPTISLPRVSLAGSQVRRVFHVEHLGMGGQNKPL